MLKCGGYLSLAERMWGGGQFGLEVEGGMVSESAKIPAQFQIPEFASPAKRVKI